MGRLGFKVPFRQVYCDTFGGWVRETFWCHVVLRVFPNAMDPGPAACSWNDPSRGHAGPASWPKA